MFGARDVWRLASGLDVEIHAGYKGRMPSILKRGELSKIISMRLSVEDKKLLDAVSNLVPAIPRLTLARLALRIGLDVVRKSPSRALGLATQR